MFVIVRHGNTFGPGEPPRRIGARTDLPLTAQGEAQALALGEHFAGLGWRFTRALVSPLLRTRDTARLILATQPEPPVAQTCEWLREIDHGPDEDRSEAEVLARIGPQALEAWDTRAEVPDGWLVEPAMRRAGWAALFAGEEPGPTLVVTSNGAARFALLAEPALAAAMPSLSSLKLPTGGYGVIRRAADRTLAVEEWGRRP